jgi:hypothetical protein
MGEEFFKRLILLFLFICSAFLIIGIVNNSRNHDVKISSDLSSDIAPDNFGTGDVVLDNSITGFASHPIYSGFSSAGSGFIFNNNTRLLSVSDTAIYKTGYYSINGSNWQSFTLFGTAYGTSSVWLTGTATKTLPSFGVGEHYIIIYSCKYNVASASWNCSDNRWQLIVVNNTPAPVPPAESCSDGIQNQGETGIDCGGPCLDVCSSGNKYYLSPSGNDNNLGTKDSPWFTLERAWEDILPGDTIYMRNGTYYYTSTQDISGKSGTAGKMIKIWAYPGETPIITKTNNFIFSGIDQFKPLVQFTGNYVHWKGIEITGNPQTNGAEINDGMYVHASSNCIFELLNVHHNGAGFGIRDYTDGTNSNNNLILNSDFHDNQDPYTIGAPYGNSDGLGININIGNTVTVRGCRFWWNTDDGIDSYGSDATLIIENSWAFYNGYLPGTFDNLDAGGSGFKLGSTYTDHGNEILMTLKNNLAYRNGFIGFDQNGARCGVELYNNIAYLNERQGFYFYDYNIAHILKNNIAYNNGGGVRISSASTLYKNTFLYGSDNSAFSVSDADFVNLDESQLLLQRKADGSLPDITFLHLTTSSDLIDNGTYVGLPYNGNAPDIGAFER